MGFIKLPHLVLTGKIFTTAEEIEEHTHELQLCPNCQHVLANDDTCYSQECNPGTTTNTSSTTNRRHR
jgi:hypothetical protein